MSALLPEVQEPQAIEVTAMLGSSVVGVKHCIDPRSGKVRPATWAIVGIAAVALIVATTAFVVSVTTAAANQRAYDYWTHVLHKPTGAFRTAFTSPVWDWLAFGGLGIAIGAAALAIARIREERRSPSYRIGSAREVDQPVDAGGLASFPLVAPARDHFVFQFAPGIEGDVTIAGETVKLADMLRTGDARPSATCEGAFALAIVPAAKIRARVGRTTFLVSSIAAPRRASMSATSLEGRTVKYLAGSLAAHLVLLCLLRLYPEDAGAANIEIASYETVATSSATTQHEEMAPPPEQGSGEPGDDPGAAETMKLPEGTAGTQTGKHESVAVQIEQHRVADEPQLARERAIEEARRAGVLGDASLTRMIASVAAESDISNGFSERDAYGTPDGANVAGDGFGFGFGRRDFGPGGGGGGGFPGNGTIGSGGYGVICPPGRERCFGRGDGGGLPGTGSLAARRHQGAVPQPRVTVGQARGDLDRATVRRYIKRNIEKITYCYERELLAHPSIEGTIEVQFFITPTGNVTSSQGSGFDGAVASCVADIIRAIEFPVPEGGGGVAVTYPFTFHATGH
jgi:hypothetical protein